MRYSELRGQLRKVISVVKMRGCNHSRALAFYEIDETGIVVGETLAGYEGALIGSLRLVAEGGDEDGHR